MKQKISLGSSISVLIGAVIAILALLRGPVQTVLLLVTFIHWACGCSSHCCAPRGGTTALRVMSIPTLAVVKNGEIVNRAVGARGKDQILSML